MKKLTLQTALRMISGFLAFFLTIGFAVSCCMMLFLNVLADTMDLTFTSSNIAAAAKITLVNVLLIAVIFTLVDHIRRKISVDRPVKIITDATEKFMKGDFSVRISPMQGAGSEGFNQIIIAINSMAQELSGIETFRLCRITALCCREQNCHRKSGSNMQRVLPMRPDVWQI